MGKVKSFLISSDFFTKIRLTLLALAFFIILLGIVPAVNGGELSPQPNYIVQQQQSDSQEIQDLKIKSLENILQELKDQKVQERLVKLETSNENNTRLLMTIATGVILMVIDTAIRLIRKK